MSDQTIAKKGRMVSVRLDDDTIKALEEHLVLSGQSQSDFLRSALIAYFSLYDSALRSYRSQSIVTPQKIVWWRRLIGPSPEEDR